MTFPKSKTSGFSLLELLLAMALFTMAAVSLAEALNLISLTVAESVEDATIREKLRGALLEAARDPNIREETRETVRDKEGISFRIETTRLNLETREGDTLDGLFEVSVTALRKLPSQPVEELTTATTFVNPDMF